MIPADYKSFDGFDQHAHAGEACSLQGATAQDAKPAFNLVKPGAVGGNKMKMYVGMRFEPAVLFGLVSVEIVQGHVEFFAGIGGNQLVHEIQELTAATATIMSGVYQTGSDVEGRKERRSSIAFILMIKTGQCPTIG